MQQADLIYRIVAIIFPILSIVILGYIYARYREDSNMSSGNRINMDVFTPALIFDAMSQSTYALADYGYLALAGLAIVLGSGLLAWPVARIMGYQWKTFVPPMMFNNCGNMGIPLILLTFGNSALPAAIILLALSNFLHFLLGQQMITQRWSVKAVMMNPMILATLLGIGVSMLPLTLPDTLRVPVHMLGQIAIPLMLFSLGVRMISIDFKDWKIGTLGALVCPLSGLLMATLLIRLIPLPPEQIPILFLFSALPPAILNFLVAERFDQQPHQVASIVLIGNLASVVFIPVLLWILI